MRSILVGNGINIQFGGNAYTNSYIMKRIKYLAKLDSYKKLFGDSIKSDEIIKVLNDFVWFANGILNAEYNDVVSDNDTKEALKDFCERYTQVHESHDIMLEDWFFILHMYFLKFPEDISNVGGARQGFERLILDAICNSGNIQNVYKKMSNKKIKRFFKEFDFLFSLNYDNNLEKLTG